MSTKRCPVCGKPYSTGWWPEHQRTRSHRLAASGAAKVRSARQRSSHGRTDARGHQLPPWDQPEAKAAAARGRSARS